MTHYVDTIQSSTYIGQINPAKDSIERWNGLSNLSRFLLESNTLHDLMERTTRSVVEILGLDYSRILSLEPNGHYYWRMSYYKNSVIVAYHMDAPAPLVAEKILHRIAATEPMLTPYYMDDSYTPEERLACSGYSKGNIWLVPLFANSQPLGYLVLGADGYTTKDQSIIESTHLVDLIAGQLSNAILRVRLNEKLSGTTLEVVQALTKALEARDLSSSIHSQTMANLSHRLAIRLGCSDKESLDIYWAALLHDIGKIGIEDNILRKPDSLTENEWKIMRKHPQIGAKIIQGMTGLDSIAPLILMHHERMDGSGYPQGLRGDQIPLGARIIAVVDSYTAMIEGRVYRSSRPSQEAIAELIRLQGIEYDSRVVEAFISMIST
jgi:HD-GYP domain-containing protein (c-di-GMP phosphodiesterase class II)